jgi:ribokinase
VDERAENTIVVVPGANGEIAPAPPPPARVVVAQLESPVPVIVDAFAAASGSGAVTILNPAPAHDVPDELLRHTRIVIPNQHERDQLGGVERLFDLGVETVIVTLGGDGVAIATADSNRTVPAFPVEPVDTTGAGDAFCGAFASALARDVDLDDAVRFAAAAGALATTKHGAVPSLPRRGEIERLVQSA